MRWEKSGRRGGGQKAAGHYFPEHQQVCSSCEAAIKWKKWEGTVTRNSYAGGTNPWGLRSSERKQLQNDGWIEVVGVTSVAQLVCEEGWHAVHPTTATVFHISYIRHGSKWASAGAYGFASAKQRASKPAVRYPCKLTGSLACWFHPRLKSNS